MKRRVLLAVLVGISLVLAVMIRSHRSVNAKQEQSLADLDRLSKAERDRFHSDAKDFYQHHSKAARNERKRLRSLYQQIQNDPENERLKKTLDQYVDWVSRFSDPATMRVIQTQPINARVDAVHNAVLEERQGNDSDQSFTLENLKASIRENLPPELQLVALSPLSDAFDIWLTEKYDEAKSSLNEEQLSGLPEFETFYRDLFRRAGIETFPINRLGIPEKLALLQLIQNLNNPPRWGGGASFRSGGGVRSGGGGGGASRFGGDFFLEGGGLRGEFLRSIDQAMESKEPNSFLDSLHTDANEALEKLNRLARMEALQGLLALAVLERYPTMSVDALQFFQMMTVDSLRFFLTSPRAEQDRIKLLGSDQNWIKLLGSYLSIMLQTRREEFLKLDSRYTTSRFQGELLGNAVSFFGLFRRPVPPNMGPPPMPPRDNLSPPPGGPNRPPRPGNGQGDRQGGWQNGGQNRERGQ
jgi:hypothetical protein